VQISLKMNKKTNVLDVLLKLGEVKNSGMEIWQDYSQYHFTEDDISELIDIVANEDLNNAPTDSNEVWILLHAWRALGQLQSERAISPLIALFDRMAKDDWVSTELPMVMGMIGEVAIIPLETYLNERHHSEYSRAIAADSLGHVVKDHPYCQSKVINVFKGYLKNPDSKATFLNGSIISEIIDTQAVELIDDIRKIHRRGYVDISISGDIEEVEIELGLRRSRSTPQPRYSSELFDKLKRHSFVRKTTKTGRNDSCLCGSGKKYKKCCLN